ncbi:hypothetical protein ACP90_19685 [Labrenzia sp. CP4]|nr:hypothetical protein ACP90_19685 [Labrenzia sp. CP4]
MPHLQKVRFLTEVGSALAVKARSNGGGKSCRPAFTSLKPFVPVIASIRLMEMFKLAHDCFQISPYIDIKDKPRLR